MNIFKISLYMALESIMLNKLRSLLTMIGIVIGMASVVVVYAVCSGGRDSVIEEVKKLGPNLIAVYRNDGAMTKEDVQTIIREVPLLKNPAPVKYQQTFIKLSKEIEDISIMGCTPAYQKVRNIELLMGRFIQPDDCKNYRKVAVLDEETKDKLFPNKNPIGEKIKLFGIKFRIIGVLKRKERKENNLAEQFANTEPTMIPLSVMQRITDKRYISILFATVENEQQMSMAAEQIKNTLLKRHQEIKKFHIFTSEEVRKIINEISNTLVISAAIIAIVSLLVGGIGIMNIMLVSVTERIKEIGIRKALGAKYKDILIQFLIEAGSISGIGGIAGTIIGIISAIIIAKFVGWPPLISVELVIFAFFFSVSVGIAFGLYPADKAAKLDPTEALRHE